MRATLRHLSLLLAFSLLGGCEPTKGDLIAQGRAALAKKQYDEAMAKFEKVLETDPQDYNALWSKASILDQQGRYAEQAEVLEAILKVKSHAEKYGAVVRPALEASYRKQAEAAKDPAQKEALLRKAIAVVPDGKANIGLAEHLIREGDRASRAGDHAAAVKAYRAVSELRVGRRLRAEAEKKADQAGFMVFKEKLLAEFEQKVQPELVEAGQYDPAAEKFIIEGVADAPGSPRDEDFEENARKAATQAVVTLLEDLTWKVAGKQRPEGVSVAYAKSDVTVEGADWVRKNRTFGMKVSVPRDAVFFELYKLEKKGILAKAAPAAAAPVDEEPAAEGEAGDQP